MGKRCSSFGMLASTLGTVADLHSFHRRGRRHGISIELEASSHLSVVFYQQAEETTFEDTLP